MNNAFLIKNGSVPLRRILFMSQKKRSETDEMSELRQ